MTQTKKRKEVPDAVQSETAQKRILITSQPYAGYNAPGTVEATIDPTRLAQVWGATTSVPALQNALGVIMRYLFADGIEVLHGGEAKKTDPEFQTHLAGYWQKFGEEVIRWIVTAGVVPITFCLLETGEWIPVVEKHGAGYIRSIYKDHRQRFVYYEYGPRGANSQVTVLAGFGYDPTIHGQLTSLSNCLLPMEAFTSVLVDSAAVAEQIRSNPAYVYQTRKDTSSGPGRLGVDFGYYAEYDTSDERNEAHMWKRDRAGIERLKRMNQEVYDTYYAPNPMNKVNVDANGALGTATPWEGNEHFVPENMELVTSPVAQTRTDFVDILKFNNDEIYTTFGVPKSMVTEDTGSKSSNSEAVNDMFKTTILWWKRTIAKIMTISYNMIYGMNDAQYILNRYYDLTKTGPDCISEDQIYALQKLNKFEINLPIPPFISSAELEMFYKNGALTPEEYIGYLRHRANLKPIDKVPYIMPREGELEMKQMEQNVEINKLKITQQASKKKEKKSAKVKT